MILAVGVLIAQGAANKVHAQSSDLCDGTGGNGKIERLGNNAFTLTRNDGSTLIVTLTDHVLIKTATGTVSAADLKVGERVTLVGGPNRDGSFSADAVVVCNGTQEGGTDKAVAVRNSNPDFERVNTLLDVSTILLFGLIWFGLAAFLRIKKKKNFVYLLFFTLFYVYFYTVLDYTLFQFQSLLLLRHFLPGLMLNGFTAGTNVNLIPLAALTRADLRTSLLNVVMMLPFGFGLPFVTSFRMKHVVMAGMLCSVAIEVLQFITGFMVNTTFRVADINDVIFNTLGVAIGYMLFVGFVRIYRRIVHGEKLAALPILRYIAERPQFDIEKIKQFENHDK